MCKALLNFDLILAATPLYNPLIFDAPSYDCPTMHSPDNPNDLRVVKIIDSKFSPVVHDVTQNLTNLSLIPPSKT